MKKLIGKTASVVLSGLLVFGSLIPAVAAKSNTEKLTGNGEEVKNVIVLISDGWGYNQIAATDYYTDGKTGTQVYEKFPTQVGMSTYSVYGEYDPQAALDDFYYVAYGATDSAAAATAMSTGIKTYDGAICVDTNGGDMTNIVEYCEDLGKATGVVTSVEFSHATPAGFVAHNPSRNNYSNIANEMIMESEVDVIIGAGNPYYNNDGELMAPNFKYVGGQSTWEGLIDGTLSVADADGDGNSDAWTLIETKEEFEALTTGETPDRLIGVPQVNQTLQQSRGGNGYADAYDVAFNDNVPTLETMTEVALNVLDNDEDGFFLMVEGGAVDWAGHANQSGRLIEEQEDFNAAVEAVCEWVQENSSWSETLVIVTGDHECGYLTGAQGVNCEVTNNGEGVMPTMAWNSGNHTNQVIPFFAKGCGAEIYKKLADEIDPVRGAYLDNTEIMDAVFALLD